MKKILSILSIALVALAFVSCNKNTPEGVIEEYVACMQKGQYEEALNLFYFKKALTDNDRQQYASLLRDKVGKEIDKKGGITGVEITKMDVAEDGNTANAEYVLKYGDGSTKDEKAKLLKVDGDWKMDSGK